MIVLVVNSGSSSLKFQVIDADAGSIAADSERRLARGVVERVGGHALAQIVFEGRSPIKDNAPLRDHRAALDWAMRRIIGAEGSPIKALGDIQAVGHRVVHGGERFRGSVLIDDAVLAGIEDCVELAPLHNPANLKSIRAARELLGPSVPQVAVFDTAFHATMPEENYVYGIPYHLYRRHKIRRYGFHGTSHRYLSYRYRKMTGTPREKTDIVTLHLGNGCSACAIKGGDSRLNSMGFTPLEGLLMGTRSGDLDPSILEFLSLKEGLTPSETDTLLNKESGLLGVSGLTSDMRELLAEEAEHGDRRARLAVEMFCRRARRTVGAYVAELGGAAAIVFGGGIGERSPEIRRRICSGLEFLGLRLDEKRNAALTGGAEGEISTDDSPLKAYAIPTDEELLIARDAFRVVSGQQARPS